MSTNSGTIESTSDAVVLSEPQSNSDVPVSNGVVVGADSLDLKTETLTNEPSSVGISVQDDLVDDARVSRGEIGVSDAVVSSVPPDASYGDKIGADLLESKSGTLIIGVQDSIDEARVSVDETGIVMTNSELVLDAVDSSEPLSNRDTDEVNGVKIGTESVGLEIEALTNKSSADCDGDADIAVLDSIDDSRASRDEKGIVMENIEKFSDENEVNNEEKEGEYKFGADSLGSETENLTTKSSADRDGDGDIAVQDSVDDSRASVDETGVVMENTEKVSDENEVNNEEKEGEYKVTDLVWAKVKNYPWWPGQIFDPSSSTDKAKKYSNKKGRLVGYFGDQSFAWNKAPNIKPFRKHFCKMEKQSISKPFLHAVNCALDEVSRRVDFGLACSCISKEVYDKVKSQVFVNSGIKKEDSKIDGGDRFSTVSTFKPVKVVQSVQELAREHFEGLNRLEVLSVRTQLLAFFRWKGYYQLQSENILDELDNKLEAESELPLTEENKVAEDEKLASLGKKVSSKKRKPVVCDSDSDDLVPHKKETSLTNVTPKGNSSAKRSEKGISKKATVDDDVIEEENENENLDSAGKKVSSKKRKPYVCDSDDSVPHEKERSLTNVTPKGNASAQRSKQGISKKATVDDDVIKEEIGNEKPDSAGKKVYSRKRKPDVCDSDASVPHKKERSLKNVTSKGNSSAKRSKRDISKKAAVDDNVIKEESEDDKSNSVGKKVSSKKKKPDDCDSDDSVPLKKERCLTKMTSKGSSGVKRSKKNISKKTTLKDNEEKGNGTDNKKSPVSSPKKLFRVGDSICRIAKQISESPSIVKKESQKSKNDENSAALKKTAKKDGKPVEATQTEE